VIKTTAEKTSTLLGGFGSSVSSKLGQLKNSESFRSFEERVGSAYENVKVNQPSSPCLPCMSAVSLNFINENY